MEWEFFKALHFYIDDEWIRYREGDGMEYGKRNESVLDITEVGSSPNPGIQQRVKNLKQQPECNEL